MSHKHTHKSHQRDISKSRAWLLNHSRDSTPQSIKPKLEIVLKCDSFGTGEAVASSINQISRPEAEINIIRSKEGDINISDVMMAETGSRLIIGYQVEVLPGIDTLLRERGVEVRLYEVIYKLTADIADIIGSMVQPANQEQITGTARVIALFKSCRKGIIAGCEVLNGHLATGQNFQIISEIGPVYRSRIESMHIGSNAVQKAVPGQQVGIKIKDFNKVKIGDLVESFRALQKEKFQRWHPTGGIIRK